MQWWKSGRLTEIRERRKNGEAIDAAFIARRVKESESGCLEWTGATNGGGYGYVSWARGEKMAHRIAWILEHGEIPDDYFVCHRCDNPRCCNVGHMFIGTPLDNTRDMIDKGRAYWQKHPAEKVKHTGKRHPKGWTPKRGSERKLTMEQADEIRSAYSPRSREYGAGPLARRYGVGYTTVLRIVRGQRYRPPPSCFST
jgi:hypothetical protein